MKNNNTYIQNDFYYVFDNEKVINALCKNERELLIGHLLFTKKLSLQEVAEIMSLTYQTIRTKKIKFLNRARIYIHTAVENRTALYNEQKRSRSKDYIIQTLNSRLALGKESMPVDKLNILIKHLKLSTRALKCLNSCEIITLGELIQFNTNDLNKFRNMGSKTINELIKIVHEHGLKFYNEK